MDALTLDQFAVFAAVVDEGSFAGAARRMNRAQSAITYAVQKLEDQTGVELFDRSAYRPQLTEAGTALLPRARRILSDLDEYRVHARRMTQGLEDELTLVVHPYAPLDMLSRVLHAFHAEFPSVRINASLGARDQALDALRGCRADLALVPEMVTIGDDLERALCTELEVVAVASPSHPLAKLSGIFPAELLRDHTRLAMHGVLSEEEHAIVHGWGMDGLDIWSIMDFRIYRELLLEGVGWGTIACSRIKNDIEEGRLVLLRPAGWGGPRHAVKVPLLVLRSSRRPPGPAGSWLFERFKQGNGAALSPVSKIVVEDLAETTAEIEGGKRRDRAERVRSP